MESMEVEESMDVDQCQISSANSIKDPQPLQTQVKRNILKAKRRTNCGEHSSMETIVVIDTNILIENLEEMKLLFVHLSQLNKRDIIFVIPMIVIQELDGLKKSSEICVKKATSFINEQLESKSLLISDVALIKKLKENNEKVNDGETEEIKVFNNDDIILQKCLLLRRLKVGKNRIILLSNDLNLRNKALAVDLKCMNYKRFSAEYSTPPPLESDETVCYVLTRNSPKKRKLSNTPSRAQCVHRVKFSCVSEAFPKEMECTSSNKNVKETKSVSDDVDYAKKWLTCKYEGERILREFIEVSLKREYGEKLWNKMFNVDPRKASLVELLRLLKQGWYAVFSDQFERNPNVEQQINRLLNSLKDENKPDILSSQLTALLKQVPSIKCDSNSTSNVSTKKRKF